jgi:hypothetical protein
MPVDAQLRSLNIDVPAQPEALVKLSLLLADDEINLQALSGLIESDMALAAAVLKAVNSSLYGLAGRVQSVQQAITFLGTREVAAVTFEMGLKAVFPPAPELEPVWERAGVRGLLMGRIAAALDVDPWASHSAGLFEECGKAVLYRHAAERYRPMLKTAKDDEELLFLEHQEFGVSHDALGAALCESWGPRAGGGAQRALPRHRQLDARAADADPAPRDLRDLGARQRADPRSGQRRRSGARGRAAGGHGRGDGAARHAPRAAADRSGRRAQQRLDQTASRVMPQTSVPS